MSKIAVFFDAENVSASVVPEIISYLSPKGEILIQRAYADWSIENTKSWQGQITKTPIMAIQQFHHNQEQAVDKAIMMDAIELAIKHENIDIFALVASDNGYYSLALRLRELGKRVVGLGDRAKCTPIWVNSCNEFAYFDDLEKVDADILLLSESDKEKDELKDFALEKFLETAFDLTPTYKNTNSVLLARLWESVLKQKPDFSIKDYGKKSVREFISSFEDNFLVTDDGKTPKTYLVEKITKKIEKIENEQSIRKTGIIKRRIGNYRIILADDGSGDYFFYMKDANADFKDEKFDKEEKVDFLVVKEPNQNATETKEKNGRATDLRIIANNE